MRKLKLALDEVGVESFVTAEQKPWKGTVDGLACDTMATDCTMGDPCPSDVENTLDAETCGGGETGGGCEHTNFATTCRDNTGRCCEGHTDVTHGTGPICCPG